MTAFAVNTSHILKSVPPLKGMQQKQNFLNCIDQHGICQ